MKIQELIHNSVFAQHNTSPSQAELKELADQIDSIASSDLSFQTEEVTSLKSRVLQGDPESLKEIFLLFLRKCPEDTIAEHLGLRVWLNQGEQKSENRKEACTRIIECFKNKTPELDISSLGLSSLPPLVWGYLPHLTSLDCFCNDSLKELPPEVCNCLQLEKLNCYACKLENLPSQIGNWKHLRVFNFVDNKIAEIPATIGDCVELRQLHTDDNLLKTLPPQIGRCRKLEALTCNNNNITTLPPEIGNCTNLRVLSCSWNEQLKELPEEIGNCTELKSLFLLKNPLTKLPYGLKREGLAIHLLHSLSEKEHSQLQEKRNDLLKKLLPSVTAGERYNEKNLNKEDALRHLYTNYLKNREYAKETP